MNYKYTRKEIDKLLRQLPVGDHGFLFSIRTDLLAKKEPKELWSVADEEKLDKENAPVLPKTEECKCDCHELGVLSIGGCFGCGKKHSTLVPEQLKDIAPVIWPADYLGVAKNVMYEMKIDQLIERINILSKSL